MKIALMVLFLAFIAIQAVPVPQQRPPPKINSVAEKDVYHISKRSPIFKKYTSGSDNFDLAEADIQKIDQSEDSRHQRSVPDLIEEEGDALNVARLTKLNKIDQSEGFFGYTNMVSRNK